VNKRKGADNQGASMLYSCEVRLCTTSWEGSDMWFPSKIDGTHSLRVWEEYSLQSAKQVPLVTLQTLRLQELLQAKGFH
jgi:hypothetical protein